MPNKLAQTLAEGLEGHLLFEELVARVLADAEREYGVPCIVSYHCSKDRGKAPPLDTIFMVTVGTIHKKRQERIEIGGKP